MRCLPEIALERIKKRGRDEEKNITIEYLNDIHRYHEEWLMDGKTKNVIVINCDKEFENDQDYQHLILNQVKLGIEKIIQDQLSNLIKNKIIISNDYEDNYYMRLNMNGSHC